MSNDDTLFAATDGSAINFNGAFGWILCDNSGNKIAQCYGPAPGYRTSSFHAEAYGLLSLFTALQRICSFTASAFPTHLSVYCDCASLVNTINEARNWATFFPNTTMSTDWDFIQAIHYALQQLPASYNLHHVKGHQDRLTPYHELPLPAQLNIDADHITTEYATANQTNTDTPLLPGAIAQLHSPQGTISSHLKPSLRRIASLEPMKQYMMDKYDWDHNTLESINWQSHSRSIRAMHRYNNFISKFIHDWLPVNNLQSKYKSHYSPKCPSCPNETETIQHFIQCPSRLQWRTDMINDISNYMESQDTRPELAIILKDALQQWFDAQPITFPLLPTIFHKLIRDQTNIGWEQLFYGRFSNEWSSLQEEHYETTDHRPTRLNGSSWTSGLIQRVWHHLHLAWLQRNSDAHGITPTQHEEALVVQARLETLSLYDHRHLVLPRDDSLFYSSPEEHFHREPTSRGLRQWLHTWQPVILTSIRESHRLGLTNIRSIRSYFLGISPSANAPPN